MLLPQRFSFGHLTCVVDGVPVVSHLPFVLHRPTVPHVLASGEAQACVAARTSEANTDASVSSAVSSPADGDLGTLEAHVSRSNLLHRALLSAAAEGREVLVVFAGPHGYVSPQFYVGTSSENDVVSSRMGLGLKQHE